MICGRPRAYEEGEYEGRREFAWSVAVSAAAAVRLGEEEEGEEAILDQCFVFRRMLAMAVHWK